MITRPKSNRPFFACLFVIIASLFMSAVLTGCITSGNVGDISDELGRKATVKDRYFAARLDYLNVLQTAVTYAERPRCTVAVITNCSRQDVIDRTYDSLRPVGLSLDVVGAAVKAGECSPGLETTAPCQTHIRTITAGLAALQAINAILIPLVTPAT